MLKDDVTHDIIGAYTRRIGTLQHFRWLRGIVAAVLVLNLLDAILTIIVVTSARATEANPLMAEVLDRHPVLFALVKMSLVSLGSVILWRHRKHAVAVLAIFVAFLAYYGVLLYHLSAWEVRLVDRLLG